MARSETEGADTWLVDLPPTPRQSRSALAVAAVALVAFGAAAPFAVRPLAQLNAFFPSLDAIVLVTDLITSVLLFTQFSISRQNSLLVLASGYLFTALIVIPHALTFSGAFSPTGLLGANIQTGSWLFIFWHAGFSVTLLAYAIFRQKRYTQYFSEAPTFLVISWSVVTLFCLVCALTWLATAGSSLLPQIVLDSTHISPIVVYPISFTMLIAAIALVILFSRGRSVLDQWLMVVAFVYILELAFSGLFPSVRFSIGFYAGRVFSLVTASIVLIVVLAQTTWLYARLARSNLMLQRERNNKLLNLEAMLGSILHEVRQPLTAIELNGDTALLFLGQTPPDIEETRSALIEIGDSIRRVNQVFGSFRILFGSGKQRSEPVNINESALGALRVLRGELKDHRIVTSVKLTSELPLVMGHKSQLDEVIINLIDNAIDAMAGVTDDRRILQVTTEHRGSDGIVVTVEDSGPGIEPESIDKIFEAFVTTKTHGMGLGLALCQLIVERHEGRLSVSSAHPHGSIFRVFLPVRKPSVTQ